MSLEPGKHLGPYRITAPLGAGGMGEVYRAHDERLDREVAVKVLPRRLAGDTGWLKRFVQEARSASALNHPGILTIHDFGREDDINYLVTELLEGESLRARLKRGTLPESEAITMGAEIARALAAAHAKGIVHRDLKPENLFLTEDGRVKILDFGLAIRVQTALTDENLSAAETAERLTREGAVIGTAGYMAPEQARGQTVDARADLFALGCVVLEMITGRPPFERGSPIDTLSAILNEDPLAHPKVSGSLSPEVERVVRHCLEKDPAKRFQSSPDVAFALESLATSSSGEISGPGSRTGRAGAAWIVPSLVAVGLVAVAGLFWFLREPAPPAPPDVDAVKSIAVLPFLNVRGAASLDYLGDGIAETLISRLSPLEGVEVLARTTVFRFKGDGVDPLQVGRQLEVNAVVSGRVEEVDGRLLIGAELVDVASGRQIWGDRFNRPFSDLFAIEEDVARRIGEGLALRLGRTEQARLHSRPTENEEAYRLYLRGRHLWYQRTRESVRESLELFRTAVELDPGFALAWNGLADAYTVGWAGYAGVPIDEAYARAETAIRQALKLDDSLPEAHTSLAFLLFEKHWDWAGAEREFQRSLDLDPGNAYTHQAYGEYLYCIGRFEDSLAHLERALELDPLSEIVASVIGWSYLAKRDTERAIRQFREVLDREPDYADSRAGLALALFAAPHPDEERAEALIKMASVSGIGSAYLDTFQAAYAEGGISELIDRIIEFQQRDDSDSWLLGNQFQAWALGLTGRTSEAVAIVERMFAARYPALTYAKTGAFLDPLRSEPRIQEILDEMNFPPGDPAGG